MNVLVQGSQNGGRAGRQRLPIDFLLGFEETNKVAANVRDARETDTISCCVTLRRRIRFFVGRHQNDHNSPGFCPNFFIDRLLSWLLFFHSIFLSEPFYSPQLHGLACIAAVLILFS